MAALTFTQKSASLYEAQLPASSGVVQIKLTKKGKVRVYASIGTLAPAQVKFGRDIDKDATNIAFKVDLPGMDKVLVTTNQAVEAAEFVEA